MDHAKTIVYRRRRLRRHHARPRPRWQTARGYELILISEESYTTFNPMLPEAVGASIFPEQVVAPIRQMLRRTRFFMGRVGAIDPRRRTLTASTLAGELSLPYLHLVLAFGNRARLDLIPGLAEHALPLKTIGDAMHIRNMVLRRVAQIELETDPAVRRRRPLRRRRRWLLRRGDGRGARRLPRGHPSLLSLASPKTS